MRRVICIVLAAISIAVSAFILNFMLFAFTVAGHASLLSFGFQGVLVFFLVFPWVWLLLVLLLIALAPALLLDFKLASWRLAFFVAGASFGIALLVGIVIEVVTPLNGMLLHDADQNQLPQPMLSLYESVHAGAPHNLGVFRGIVTSIGTSGFTIAHDDFDHDTDEGSLTIIPPNDFNLDSLMPGDRVYVAGAPTASGIETYGIKAIPQAPAP